MTEFIQHFRFAQPQWLLLLIPCLLLFILRRGRGAEAALTFSTLSVLVSLGAKVRRSDVQLRVGGIRRRSAEHVVHQDRHGPQAVPRLGRKDEHSGDRERREGPGVPQ